MCIGDVHISTIISSLYTQDAPCYQCAGTKSSRSKRRSPMDAFPTTKRVRKQVRRALDGPQETSLMAEAESLQTSPDRLAQLAKSGDPFVQVTALRNPNLPTDGFFDAMFR